MGERYWAKTGIERIEGKEGRSRVPGISARSYWIFEPYEGRDVG